MNNLWDREQRFIRDVIIPIESRGVLIDTDMCRRYLAIGEGTMNRIRSEINLNPGSTKDLHTLLIDQMNLPVFKRTPKGKPSFDKEAMEDYDLLLSHLGNPLARQVLTYRGWQKSCSSFYRPYLNKLGKDGRLRPHFKVHGTKTSRMSAEDPNTQQIPKGNTGYEWNEHIKECFLAPNEFVLLNVDYSQVEFRTAAAYAKEEVLLDAFNDPTRDVFTEMSVALNRPRNQCKTFTYATLYGAQTKKIGEVMGLKPHDAEKFGNDWRNRYSRIMDLADQVNSLARSRGYIKLWTGRRRHFPDPRESRKAFNSLIQGGGAEIVKSAMIRVMDRVDRKGYYQMLLQVHDSIVGEARISELEQVTHDIQTEMGKVSEEKDFGVLFSTEADFWGPKMVAA